MFNWDDHSPRREEFHLNLTALIDVVMVILLFFVTSMTFSKVGVKINQPTSSQTQALEKSNIQEVSITKSGQVVVDKQPVTSEEFKALLLELVNINPEIIIILNPDKDTKTQYLMDVLDACKTFGVKRISIATKPKHD